MSGDPAARAQRCRGRGAPRRVRTRRVRARRDRRGRSGARRDAPTSRAKRRGLSRAATWIGATEAFDPPSELRTSVMGTARTRRAGGRDDPAIDLYRTQSRALRARRSTRSPTPSSTSTTPNGLSARDLVIARGRAGEPARAGGRRDADPRRARRPTSRAHRGASSRSSTGVRSTTPSTCGGHRSTRTAHGPTARRRTPRTGAASSSTATTPSSCALVRDVDPHRRPAPAGRARRSGAGPAAPRADVRPRRTNR